LENLELRKRGRHFRDRWCPLWHGALGSSFRRLHRRQHQAMRTSSAVLWVERCPAHRAGGRGGFWLAHHSIPDVFTRKRGRVSIRGAKTLDCERFSSRSCFRCLAVRSGTWRCDSGAYHWDCMRPNCRSVLTGSKGDT